MANVRCLNELVPKSCQSVFRPWSKRLEEPEGGGLLSDPDDAELLLHIPFTGAIKLTALTVIGGGDEKTPATMRLFINREDLDFGLVHQLQPVQEFELQPNARGEIEYPTQVLKFSGVHHLTIHFPRALIGDQSHVVFVGLKGEFSERRREAVQAVYELKPLKADTKVGEEAKGFMRDLF